MAVSLAAAVCVAVALAAPARAATVTSTSTADTYVRSDKPTSSFGTAKTLLTDGSPRLTAYLRFTVAGTSGGAVSKATLRVWANSRSNSGVTAAAVADTTWGETALTWNTAPAIGASAGSSGPVSSSTWLSFDVTSLVRGDG